MYFRYFVIISPWKRAGPFLWTNLNPLYRRMLCAKFGWNWLSGSGEEDENVKSLRQRRRQRRQRRRTTDKFWSEEPTWAFGSGELKMKAANLPLPYYGVSSEVFLVDQTSNCFKNTLKNSRHHGLNGTFIFFQQLRRTVLWNFWRDLDLLFKEGNQCGNERGIILKYAFPSILSFKHRCLGLSMWICIILLMYTYQY